MNIHKLSVLKKALVPGMAALGILVSASGPAAATSPGAGTFAGFEYAPASDFTPPAIPPAIPPDTSALCARFKATAGDPLLIESTIAGTAHGSAGTGTANFRATTTYYANPLGTYSDDACTTSYAVPGTLAINFVAAVGASQSCSAAATYQRIANSVIEIKHTASCNGAIWSLNGGQEPCPLTGCVVNDASSVVEGVYSHT